MNTDLLANGLAALLEHIPTGLAVLDREFRYVAINRTLAQFNGATVEQHLGSTVQQILPQAVDEIIPKLQYVLDTGEPLLNFEIQADVPSIQGQKSLWQASYLPITDPAGQVTGISVVAVNRTLELAMEHERQKSEALVQRVIDNLFSFVGILNPDGTLIYANQSPLEAAGIRLADVQGKKFWDCYWWNYSPAVQKQLQQSVARVQHGHIDRFDVVVRMANDTRMTIDFMLAPLYNEHGELTHLIPSAIDISSRKASESLLQASEMRFRKVFNAAADGLIAVNQQGRISMANESALQMFGYQEHELLGQTVEILLPDEYQHHHQFYRDSYLANPSTRMMSDRDDLFGKRKDLSLFPVQIGLTDLYINNEHVALATIVDVTKQKSVQKNLLDILEEKTSLLNERTALLNEIHHRVKNNLQVVSSLINLQSRNAGDASKQVLAESQMRVKTMALIHQLLYEQKDFEQIQFATYIERLVMLLKQSVVPQNLRLQWDLTELDRELHLSISQAMPCGLVLNEIITNALKHAFTNRNTGTIQVSLRQHSDHRALLTVSDDGVGLDEHIELGSTHSIGFQLIPSLIDQLDGKLTLVRKPGTTFIIDFDLEREEK